MSIRELFPPDSPHRMKATLYDADGNQTGIVITLRMCHRCCAWISSLPRHVAWHRSVDTDQTADLAQPWRDALNMLHEQLHTPRPDEATMVPTDTQGTRHDDTTRHRLPDPPGPPHDS